MHTTSHTYMHTYIHTHTFTHTHSHSHSHSHSHFHFHYPSSRLSHHTTHTTQHYQKLYLYPFLCNTSYTAQTPPCTHHIDTACYPAMNEVNVLLFACKNSTRAEDRQGFLLCLCRVMGPGVGCNRRIVCLLCGPLCVCMMCMVMSCICIHHKYIRMSL